jgi:hypothetical protein
MSVNVDPVLAAALAPLLRDLEAGGVPEPRIAEPAPPFFDPSEPGLMLYAPDGSGQGILLLADAPRPEQLANLADQVQEWAVEALWSIGRSAVWPQCPEHPDSHPLKPLVADEYTAEAAAVWQCPKSGRVVAPIGELPSPRA